MDVAASLAISSSALHAQRLRMDVIAANLANAQSTQSPEGGPYKRRDVVLETMPGERFADVLGAEGGGAVRVARIVEDEKPPRVVFDPGHPDADAKGYVAYPNVNPITEMVDLMAATRAYEANIAAVNATKRVLEAALSIGQGLAMEIKDITNFPNVAGLGGPEAPKPSGDKGAGSFANVLQQSLGEVNQMQQKADAAVTALATGEKVSLHETMIAVEQADVSFRLMMQVRNKIVEAYQEILRMQV